MEISFSDWGNSADAEADERMAKIEADERADRGAGEPLELIVVSNDDGGYIPF